MTTVRPGDVDRFIERGGRDTPLILLFGPDEGLVRARARAVTSAALGANADALQLVELDAETLNADPGRLLDEANAMSMFGGRRVIQVRGAGRLAKSAWQPLLDGPPLDSVLLFFADDLAKSSPLRVAFEAAKACAAIACYPPSTADMLAALDVRCTNAGLTITPAARSALGELLGSDFALSHSEIDKLLLYCHGQLTIELSDIEAVIVDTSEAAAQAPVDHAFEGRINEVERSAMQSFRDGINPSGLLALALGHAFVLRRLVDAAARHGLDAAMRTERIFFRRQDTVRRQAQQWSNERLSRAIDVLATAQENSRRTNALEDAVVVRALWSVAMAAKRR